MTIVDVFFFVLTVVIAYQIYSKLGIRSGAEAPNNVKDPFKARVQSKKLSEGALKDAESPEFKGQENILKVEQNFSVERFLEGANKAFETIVRSFAAGDKKALKPLLSEKLYKHFSAAIDDRLSKSQSAELSYFRIISSKINEGLASEKALKLLITFKSDQILLLRDKGGKIIDGDEDTIETLSDEWTFERPMKPSNPNWVLVDAKSNS